MNPGTYVTKYCRKVANWDRVAGAIISLVSAWGLHLECVRVLHEGLLMFVVVWQ